MSGARVLAESLWDQLDGDPEHPDECGGWLQYAEKALAEALPHIVTPGEKRALMLHAVAVGAAWCQNCGGRKCMDCVFRYVHDECGADCPDCCGADNITIVAGPSLGSVLEQGWAS